MDLLFNLIKDKSPGSIPLFLAVRGSHAYGTNVEGSDIDYTGVFCQSMEDILGMVECDQINDSSSDIVIYEIKRFLELVTKNNPIMLEIINTPDDCVIYKHPIFDIIINNKDKFLTKGCMYSFGGYAKEQISKARGQNKKQNWETSRMSRKTPIDFCYFIDNDRSVPLLEFLSKQNVSQYDCGLSKVSHAKDLYSLYFGDMFRGIIIPGSNDIRTSIVPNGSKFIGNISYNKDGYTKHCVDYKSYQTWIENRNDQRWVDVESHGQKIDGKNMLHCRRLISMAKEIAMGKGVIVRRPDFEYLISIRKGMVDLESLIDQTNIDLNECDDLFMSSNLPDKIDTRFINDILIKIRKSVLNVI